VSLLALTIASVLLLASAQEARRGARYYSEFSWKWREGIWAAYHLGIVALLAGLGAALPPPGGVGTQQTLRWYAVGLAFAAALVEAILAVRVVINAVRVAIKARQGRRKGKGAALDPH
jgi:hypothetical protein